MSIQELVGRNNGDLVAKPYVKIYVPPHCFNNCTAHCIYIISYVLVFKKDTVAADTTPIYLFFKLLSRPNARDRVKALGELDPLPYFEQA